MCDNGIHSSLGAAGGDALSDTGAQVIVTGNGTEKDPTVQKNACVCIGYGEVYSQYKQGDDIRMRASERVCYHLLMSL